MSGGRVYSFSELVLEARASDRSVRRFVTLGMPTRQHGKPAVRKGEKSIPYIFGPEALEWIERHRAEKAARGETSPFQPTLDERDPRHAATLGAIRRIEIQVAVIRNDYYFRDEVMEVYRADKIVRGEILRRIPGRVTRAIAAIGDRSLNAEEIGKRVGDMIEQAVDIYSVEGIFSGFPIREVPPQPEELDAEDGDKLDSDSDGPELARRYHRTDPRYKLTKLRTLLQGLRNAIATGELIERAPLRAEHNMTYSVIKSSLGSIAARVVQPLTQDIILARRLMGIINQGIYAAYAEFGSPETNELGLAILKGADPLDLNFECDPLDEPEIDLLADVEPEPELELDGI